MASSASSTASAPQPLLLQNELARLKYYTPDEVALHNCAEDCWVSISGLVYDLSKLIEDNRGPLAMPIITAAGRDVSHWFDVATGDVKMYVDPSRNLHLPYTPHGRFLHVPPPEPTADWSTSFGLPWWRDPQYIIGRVSYNTRKVRVVNMLTYSEDLLTICAEETVYDMLRRYLGYNAHSESYTWKALQGGEFRPLDMSLTLEQNGIADPAAEFGDVGVDADSFVPTIHLYFNDDLTIA